MSLPAPHTARMVRAFFRALWKSTICGVMGILGGMVEVLSFLADGGGKTEVSDIVGSIQGSCELELEWSLKMIESFKEEGGGTGEAATTGDMKG